MRFAAVFVLIIPLSSFVVLSSLSVDIWDDLKWGEQRNTEYCERVAHASVKEPINAWTNIAFVLAGASILDRVSVQDPEFVALTVLGITLVALGQFSFLFHASHIRVWQKADASLTKAVPVVLLAYALSSLLSTMRFTNHAVPVMIAALALLIIGSSLEYDFVFPATLAPTFMLILAESVYFKNKTRSQMVGILSVFALFLGAFICRRLEVTGRWCDADAIIQPHALWHVGSALAVYVHVRTQMSDVPQISENLERSDV